MRALIVANGDVWGSVLRELRLLADVIIAADGGADRALEEGVEVNFAVGDLDSISDYTRQLLGDGRVFHEPDPDRTDLQKAIEFALSRGATAIDIVGAAGSRADHTLANLSVLALYRSRAALRIVDHAFEISLVDREAVIERPAGTVVSLVAIGVAKGVTTTGLRWDLTGFDLSFGTHGIHNEVATPPATVRVASGDLLLFTGRFIEHHS